MVTTITNIKCVAGAVVAINGTPVPVELAGAIPSNVESITLRGGSCVARCCQNSGIWYCGEDEEGYHTKYYCEIPIASAAVREWLLQIRPNIWASVVKYATLAATALALLGLVGLGYVYFA